MGRIHAAGKHLAMKNAVLLLLICIAPGSLAEPLGRLFHTPAERARLDAGTASTSTNKLRLDGRLRSEQHPERHWLNGTLSEPLVRPIPRQVGDSIDLDTGRTEALLPTARITIERDEAAQ